MEQFEFAGFGWPRNVSMLPRGDVAKRLERKRNPVTGPYYHAPKPGAKAAFFYLDSDFMPGLRWQYCDDISNARIRHTGWFTNEFQDDKIRGVVFRLPNKRGFLAGWTMGEGMASELDYYVWDDEVDAAHAADSQAEDAAERQREYEEEENERIRAEEEDEED